MLHPPFIYTPWKKVVLESFKLSLGHLGLVCQELVRQDWSCDYQECQWGKESSNPLHLNKQHSSESHFCRGFIDSLSFKIMGIQCLGTSQGKNSACRWIRWRSTFKLSKREQFLCSFPLWFDNKLMCITSQAVCNALYSWYHTGIIQTKNLQSKQAWEKPGHHGALYRCLISHLISAGKSDGKSIFSPVPSQPLSPNWVCQECQGIKTRTQRCY